MSIRPDFPKATLTLCVFWEMSTKNGRLSSRHGQSGRLADITNTFRTQPTGADDNSTQLY